MEVYFSTWKVKQLKDHLRSLGLSNIGNKDVLIERILKSDLERLTVKQLKNSLLALDFPITGNKDVLIKRLQQSKSLPSKYSKMTVKILKEILNKRKLSTTGLKATLVNRLEEHDMKLSLHKTPSSKRTPSPNLDGAVIGASLYGMMQQVLIT